MVAPPQGVISSILGSTQHGWGTYEMPSVQSPLRKRAPPQKEAPLEPEPTAHSAPIQSSTSQFSSFLEETATNSTPLRGILPACFTSQSACEALTRNCSGHGSCSKKYSDLSADSKSPYKDCYSCACSATTTKDSEGRTTTTSWGGPACQKKDVSVAFWLLALFGIGLMFLVSFAVGEVLSMGNLELPSVIGAGVSGPVKRG